MESYIQISKLNDFIFCPYSVYFHSIYDIFSPKLYHRASQTIGKLKHKNIEKWQYSTAKRYIQGLSVYSDKYKLMGKIDIYDAKEHCLIERKNKIKKIYDGYKYQLYAQYFCLKEMKFEVKKLFFHSLSDNKRYEINLPDEKETEKFEKIIQTIKNFNLAEFKPIKNPNKCANCIYIELCF
ncbi:MAG: hypothetical protein ACD_79C00707G0002 [uncultured bacterium]|nr:MAG: hypothetical protein ACD_79C00707G0002 [uncultured bacterium]